MELLIRDGVHVPFTPLLDMVGKRGAVVPAQNGAMGVKVGMKIGFDRITPVKRLVVQPLMSNEKLEYNPAFNPVITIWPLPLAT